MSESSERLSAIVEHVSAGIASISMQVDALRSALEDDRLDMREVRTTLLSLAKMIERLEVVVLTGNGGESLKALVSRMSREVSLIRKDVDANLERIESMDRLRRRTLGALIVALISGVATIASGVLNYFANRP